MDNIKAKIREFLSPHIRLSELTDDEDMFSNGHVNSLLALSLVLFMESEFRISISDEELNMDRFRSLNSIATFIQEKMLTGTSSK